MLVIGLGLAMQIKSFITSLHFSARLYTSACSVCRHLRPDNYVTVKIAINNNNVVVLMSICITFITIKVNDNFIIVYIINKIFTVCLLVTLYQIPVYYIVITIIAYIATRMKREKFFRR